MYDWDDSWYSVNKYGDVFIDVPSLPHKDSRITNELRNLFIIKFQVRTEYYLLDVILSKKPVRFTQPLVAQQIEDYNPEWFEFESNKDGAAYAREVERVLDIRKRTYTSIKTHTTTSNKKTRILNNAGRVLNFIHFRTDIDKQSDYSRFLHELTSLQKEEHNDHDDTADVVTRAAELLFFKSFSILDVLSPVQNEIKAPVITYEDSYDEQRYKLYNRIIRKKQVEISRLKYKKNMRNYLISLLLSIDSDYREFLISEIKRLDIKYYSSEKPLKRLP